MEDKNPIQVADRLFLVLETLADTGSVTLAELCRQLSLNKSTIHRLLSSLIYMGYVKQDSETGKYSLTLKLLGLSNKLLSHMDILDAVRPSLKALAEKTGRPSICPAGRHRGSIYLQRRIYPELCPHGFQSRKPDSPLLFRRRQGNGRRHGRTADPVIWEHSTIRKLTPHTIIDYPQFLAKIKEVREKGYALDDEENELGVRCIAVGLPDYRGRQNTPFPSLPRPPE